MKKIVRKLNSTALAVSIVAALTIGVFAYKNTVLNTEILTITALGESGENSSTGSQEVAIKSITAKGKAIELAPIEGKWFWNPNYMWRPESDIRQPAGVMRTVKFKIPVGTGRQVNFLRDIWRGKATVLVERGVDGDSPQLVDTYAEDGGEKSFALNDSARALTMRDAAQRGFLALVIGLAVLSGVYIVISILIRRKESIALLCKKYYGTPATALICAVITVLSLVVMLKFAGGRSLWSDDLATIQFINKGQTLSQIVNNIKGDMYGNPPFFYIFAAFWLRIMPYGTFYLKLQGIIFAALGMLLCGLIAHKLKGKRAAIFATLFAGTSWYLIILGAYTFRCYGMLFTFTALFIWLYIKRSENYCFRNSLQYGIVIALLNYTHYLGLLTMAAFFAGDLLLFLKKKTTGKFIISYFIAGLLFLPYLGWAFSLIKKTLENFWPTVPSSMDLLNQFHEIFSNSEMVYSAFFAAIVILISAGVSRYARDLLKIEPQVPLILVFSFCFTLWFVYFYSKYLNPSASLFVSRYFISVLPMGLITAALGLDFICDLLFVNFKQEHSNIISSVLICVLTVLLGQNAFVKTFEDETTLSWSPYEQTIDYYLYKQEKVYRPDTLVTITGYAGYTYYVTHGGKRDSFNVGGLTAENYGQYNFVFCAPLHGAVSNEAQQILNSYYRVIDKNDQYHVTLYEKHEKTIFDGASLKLDY